MNTSKNYTSKPESVYNKYALVSNFNQFGEHFGIKFIQKKITDKNSEKINIKIVISIQQFTPV